MRFYLIIILLVIFSDFYSYGQNPDVLEYKSISINGITWESTEMDLRSAFGNPDTLFDPQFDCGGYSTENQEINSVILYRYSGIDFLMVDNQVVFQDIYFNKGDKLELKIDKIILSNLTTLKDLKKLFPNSYENWLTDEYGIFRLWPCNFCDSEIWLHIKNGHIERVQFWEPC